MNSSGTPHNPKAGILFEIIQIGHTLKVTAIDEITGKEISVIGPTSAPLSTLQYMAMKKLNHIISKTS